MPKPRKDINPAVTDLAPAQLQSGGGDTSQVFNSPMMAPFLSPLLSGSPAIDFTSVPDETGLHNGQGGAVPPQGAVNDLMRYRHDFPFLPIVPLPQNTFSIVLAANVAKDFPIPDGAVFARFKANNDFFACAAGNAKVPVLDGEPSFFMPDDLMFYVGGRSAISVVSAFATIVSGYFWFANERPTYELD